MSVSSKAARRRARCRRTAVLKSKVASTDLLKYLYTDYPHYTGAQEEYTQYLGCFGYICGQGVLDASPDTSLMQVTRTEVVDTDGYGAPLDELEAEDEGAKGKEKAKETEKEKKKEKETKKDTEEAEETGKEKEKEAESENEKEKQKEKDDKRVQTSERQNEIRSEALRSIDVSDLGGILLTLHAHTNDLVQNLRTAVGTWPPVLDRTEEEGREIITSMVCMQVVEIVQESLLQNGTPFSESQLGTVRAQTRHAATLALDEWKQSSV